MKFSASSYRNICCSLISSLFRKTKLFTSCYQNVIFTATTTTATATTTAAAAAVVLKLHSTEAHPRFLCKFLCLLLKPFSA
jgi:hypothetical protein